MTIPKNELEEVLKELSSVKNGTTVSLAKYTHGGIIATYIRLFCANPLCDDKLIIPKSELEYIYTRHGGEFRFDGVRMPVNLKKLREIVEEEQNGVANKQ
jgi:hypothetical protein